MKKNYWRVSFYAPALRDIYRRIPIKDVIDLDSAEVKSKLQGMFEKRVKAQLSNAHVYHSGYLHMCAQKILLHPLPIQTVEVNIFAPRVGNSKIAVDQLLYVTAWSPYTDDLSTIQKSQIVEGGIKTRASQELLHKEAFESDLIYGGARGVSPIMVAIMRGAIVPSSPIDPFELAVQTSLGLCAEYIRSIPPKLDLDFLAANNISDSSNIYNYLTTIVQKMQLPL